MTLFLPYFMTAYVLISVALYLGLRPKCNVNGILSDVILGGICFTWIVSLPFAFWYHGQQLRQVAHDEEAGY